LHLAIDIAVVSQATPVMEVPFVWSSIAQVYGHSREGGFFFQLSCLLHFISNAVFCNFCNLLTFIAFFLHLQYIASVTFWKRCGDPFATLEFAPSFLFALHLTPSWAACSPPPARGGSLAFNSRFQLQFNSIRFNSISICFQFSTSPTSLSQVFVFAFLANRHKSPVGLCNSIAIQFSSV
jgi:hypothetical protein